MGLEAARWIVCSGAGIHVGSMLLLVLLVVAGSLPFPAATWAAPAAPAAVNATPAAVNATVLFQNSVAMLREYPSIADTAGNISLWPRTCRFAGTEPFLQVFVTPTPARSRAAVLIIPGGAYSGVAVSIEGGLVARWFNQRGISAFVLVYRTPWDNGPHAPLQDGTRALRLIRIRAKGWGINPHRVGIVGFSAGGHVGLGVSLHYAHMFASRDQDKCMTSELRPRPRPWARLWFSRTLTRPPDFLILVYPVVSIGFPLLCLGLCQKMLLGTYPDPLLIHFYSLERHVTPSVPPTFLLMSRNDPCVPPSHSMLLANAYRDVNRPLQVHLIPGSCHAYSIGMCPLYYDNSTQCDCVLSAEEQTWTHRLEAWLRLRRDIRGS
eukprot:RCo033712